jgi:hypothetical protein
MKTILLTLLLSLTLLAYIDSDMDGVDDSVDKCPNTPITELVDINGCTTKMLVSPHHFDIVLGVSYSQVDYNTNELTNNISQSVQVDYYYKNFSIQASSSYFTSESKTYSNSGINDSYISIYYSLKPSNRISLQIGAGAIIPTYDSSLKNNTVDYIAIVNISYLLDDNINIFGGYNYTMINDNDVNNTQISVTYKNTNSFSGGIGFYPTPNLYASIAYNNTQSIYTNVNDIQSTSLYMFYNIDEHYFTSFSYAYGLSDSTSDHYASLRIGYYF